MPRPSLARSLAHISTEIPKLEKLRTETRVIEANAQYIVSEIVFLRAFTLLERFIADAGTKLVAGADYLDGTPSRTLVAVSSMSAARQEMLTKNRPKPLQHLKWVKTSDIKSAVKFTLPIPCKYIDAADVHGSRLSEMKKVRNYIAHRSQSSRKQFRQLVRSTYGFQKKISVGQFLISPHGIPMTNLDRYLIEIKAIAKDFV